MKKLFKIGFALMLTLLSSVAIAVPVSGFIDTNPLDTAKAIFGLGVVTSFVLPAGVMPMAIQKEMWVKYIIDTLFEDNEFLKFAFNADEHVLSGKVVHITRANSKPGTEKNRTTLPATVVKRNHEDITYAVDEFTTNPELIANAETIELAYDKLSHTLGQHVSTLREDIANNMLYNWVTSSGGVTESALQLRTLGAAVTSHTGAATGNRRKLTKESLKAARTLMNKNKISKKDRYALIDSDMMDQLLDDADLMVRDSSMELDVKNGVITKLYGFNLIERSDVLVYDNTATPVVKAIGAAGAAADNAAAICWQKDAVERAMGTVKVFDETDSPIYFGSIYSALVRMGGRLRRKEGVVVIVQAAIA